MGHFFLSLPLSSKPVMIVGNVGTMILFTLGDPDARALRGEIGEYEPEDAVNLGRFECLCRPVKHRAKPPINPVRFSTSRSNRTPASEVMFPPSNRAITFL